MIRQDYNPARPMVMHVDLNSCFATIEQQSRPRLRGRPIAIGNRRMENAAIVTASYEAKSRGVKVGMRFQEAKRLVPELLMIETDPAKYKYVYHQLKQIMEQYSSRVLMKSIDEGVIDFSGSTEEMLGRGLEAIGHDIKRQLRHRVGPWMSCNVGIGPNRFLAKMAAGLNKPDGLDVIDSTNLRATLSKLKLTDLTGIAAANSRRLMSVGINTPLQFLDADIVTLEKMVFRSVNGRDWHQRLRGWEVDDVTTTKRQIGRQYVLEKPGLPRNLIMERLHNLGDSVGSRLRGSGYQARGVYVYARLNGGAYWHASRLSAQPFTSSQEIHRRVEAMFHQAPDGIREIGVHCYKLSRGDAHQLDLFQTSADHDTKLSGIVDTINNVYGDRVIHTADTLSTDQYVKSKIPFGSTDFI
ncbi:MAG: hypothetical protein L0H36_02485 [bacterium]|nr:hypothetical protein [bacterium]